MKSTKKIMLGAGLLLQLSASLYADNWSDAFLAFGGGTDPVTAAESVLNAQNGVGAVSALTVAQNLNTPEGYAVARWMANSKKTMFKSALQDADVQAAGQSIVNSGPVRSTPVNSVPVTSAPATTTPVVTAPVEPTITTADIQAAMVAQQKADAALAASNSQALSNLVTSNATGASLYNSYIDLILNALMQALNSIVDPAVQQQVIGYTQNKLANMKASASSVSNSSRVIGRMSSQKKTVKKNKHSRSHVAR